MQTWKPTILPLSPGRRGLGFYQAWEGSLSFRRPIDDQFCTSEEVMGFDGFCHPMSEMDETIPASYLGRGGGGAGFGGGGRSFEQGFGVMTTQAPFENGLCGPDQVVGMDGTCQPRTTIMMMGQTAPTSSPAAPGTPRMMRPGGSSNRRTLGIGVAAIGLGAGLAQIFSKNEKLKKVAFWTELGAIALLGGIIVGIPGIGSSVGPAPATAPAPTTTG